MSTRIATGLLLAMAACSAADDSPAAPTSASLNQNIEYVVRRTTWATSAVGGDRGTTWREGGGDFSGWAWMKGPLGYGETYVNPIPYGPDASHKPPTVYFRTSFDVRDPAAVLSLRLAVMYDDGFVAYLNGQEVQRASMPAGGVGYTTLSTGHEANNAYVTFDVSSRRGALKSGTNWLAIEVHQVSPASSDLVFDAGLTGVELVAPPPAWDDGILSNSIWSYWDRGGDLGSAWRQPSFDASSWGAGVGPLGYGETYVRTPISFGSDPANKHVTTYFRKQFQVNHVDSVSRMFGQVMFDDGIVVYLNGQRIGGDKMPTGTITSATLALPHEANQAYETYDWTSSRSLLVQGVNTIAVEVHQAERSSSDLVFDLQLLLALAPPPPVREQTFARGSSWSYWDRGGDLGTAWRGRGYDDTAWSSGAGPLGYGESYVRTPVSYGPDANNKYVTTYFRKKFFVDLSGGLQVTDVLMELLYDDGAVVYLNGQELTRTSMPGGQEGGIGAGELALGHEANFTYELWGLGAQPGRIVAGENVIAVEIHQVAPSSSDLVFDLALEVQTAPVFTRYPGNPIIRPPGPASWQEHLHEPSVVHMTDGSWVMFYEGSVIGSASHIGRAVSTDGIAWSLGADPVIMDASGPSALSDGTDFQVWYARTDQLGVNAIWYNRSDAGPVVARASWTSVIRDGTGFRMWYRHSDGLGMATSSDGVGWTHHPSLVFEPVQRFTVIKDGDEYKMWFPEESGFRYATSPDGIHWTRRGISLPQGGAGAWDQFLDRASVVRDGGVLKMWYAASFRGMGYATSP